MGAETITRDRGGRWHGRNGMIFCPVHDNTRTPALSIADGEDGKLLVHCFAGCDPVAILRAIGADGMRERRHSAQPRLLKKAPSTETVSRIWGEAVAIDGTLGERYLRGRAIEGPLPASLRFHPRLWHGASGQAHPAMVAQVCRADGAPVALHRTYLNPQGGKAAVEPAKAMLGPCAGAGVCLALEGPTLVIAEGIESALSVRDRFNGGHIMAALSTSGMSGFVLPDRTGDLVIAPDGDAPGVTAAQVLARRAYAQGWRINMAVPPDGKDWNDVAREGASWT